MARRRLQGSAHGGTYHAQVLEPSTGAASCPQVEVLRTMTPAKHPLFSHYSSSRESLFRQFYTDAEERQKDSHQPLHSGLSSASSLKS